MEVYESPLELDAARGSKVVDVTDMVSQFVPIPEGAYARFLPGTGLLLVRNTDAHHKVLAEALDKIRAARIAELGRPLEIDLVVVEFPLAEIAGHPRLREEGGLPGAEVVKLFRGGKGRVLSVQKVVGSESVEVYVGSVEEITVPVEFEGGADTNALPVVPTQFETREAGLNLSLTATALPKEEGVLLTLAPEMAALKGWLDGVETDRVADKTGPVSQPVLESVVANTTMRLRFGEPGIAFAAPHPRSRNPVYGLLTVRRPGAR